MSSTLFDFSNVNKMFKLYLFLSYAYYVKNISLVSDEEYDVLCKFLYDMYDEITHYHKHLIDREDFESTTGYRIAYPQIVQDSADIFIKEVLNVE